VLCTQSPGGVTEDEYVEMLLDRQVSGIVFISSLSADTTSDRSRYQRLLDRPLPIVLVNGYAKELEAPFVSCDDRVAGDLGVAHLVALGHRRIGIISGPNRFINTQRKLEGYRAAMRREVGLSDPEIDDLVSLTLFGVEGGEVAAERLLAKGVTGIICASDMMALGAIRAARRRGLRVPEEVSVIGFDDSALIPFTDPPLTTLRQPVASMAVAAVRSLVDEINGHGAPHSEYLFHPELVVRNSTAIAPMRSQVPVATPAA
jgi:DNA-binding LacI/PurR family transcriptional regulator